MNRGGKSALLFASIGLNACAATMHDVKVRPISNSTVKLARGDDLAVAQGQLALGNVGLALEAFRKIQRARPMDPAPLQGISDCYALMGRYDLAQSNLEAALALAPRDPKLLNGLARILDLSGQPDRAARARLDARSAVQDTPPVVVATEAENQRVESRSNSITVSLPPARPIAQPQPAASKPALQALSDPVAPEAKALAQGKEMPPADQGALTAPMAMARPQGPPPQSPTGPRPEVRPAPVSTVPVDATEKEQPVPAALNSMLLAERLQMIEPIPFVAQLSLEPAPVAEAQLPAMREIAEPAPVTARPAVMLAEARQPQSPAPRPPALSSAMTLPAAPPADRLPKNHSSENATLQAARPRLERLAAGEVALITTGQPIWRQMTKQRLAQASPVQWIPLVPANSRANVQLLNAARTQGLAASARSILLERGWRKIAIGNMPKTMTESVVLYPRGRAALARRLAAQFGIGTRMMAGKSVVLILGRDKVATIRRNRPV